MGATPCPAFVTTYMDGFGSFVASWLLMFLLGSLFGKFMEDTGSADSEAGILSGAPSPSCGARRMAETAALLADEVFPDVRFPQ